MARDSRVQSRRAADMTALEQRFVWRGRLPVGHISVIAGPPAAGKSTLGYHIAADADVPTIFVTTEEADRAVWRPRIESSGMTWRRRGITAKFSSRGDRRT